MVADFVDLCLRERFKIHDEVVAAREVRFRLLVETSMHGVVGALEEPVLAVGDELVAVRRGSHFSDAVQLSPGNNDRHADVVFRLDLLRRGKVLTKLVSAPAVFTEQADSQIIADKFTAVVLQFVAGRAIDDVDGKQVSPVGVCVAVVKPLDNKYQRVNVAWN